MVVSNIFYFHPYLGKWSNLTNIFQRGWNNQLDHGFIFAPEKVSIPKGKACLPTIMFHGGRSFVFVGCFPKVYRCGEAQLPGGMDRGISKRCDEKWEAMQWHGTLRPWEYGNLTWIFFSKWWALGLGFFLLTMGGYFWVCMFLYFFWVHRNCLAVPELYQTLFWNRMESSLAPALVIYVQLVEMHTWWTSKSWDKLFVHQLAT